MQKSLPILKCGADINPPRGTRSNFISALCCALPAWCLLYWFNKAPGNWADFLILSSRWNESDLNIMRALSAPDNAAARPKCPLARRPAVLTPGIGGAGSRPGAIPMPLPSTKPTAGSLEPLPRRCHPPRCRAPHGGCSPCFSCPQPPRPAAEQETWDCSSK